MSIRDGSFVLQYYTVKINTLGYPNTLALHLIGIIAKKHYGKWKKASFVKGYEWDDAFT